MTESYRDREDVGLRPTPLPRHATWDDRTVGELQANLDAPLEVYASIGSTHQRALEWSQHGAPAWSTVIADEQTAGRGRRGKRWESRAGLGLWMSVVVPAVIERSSALSLHAGLVSARAAERVAEEALGIPGTESVFTSGPEPSGVPRPRIQLKWPNDLEFEGKKVAGVLCETAGKDRVVVGVGFNVLHGGSDFGPLDRPASSLKAVWGVRVSRSLLASAILRGLRAVRSFAVLDERSLAELRSRDALVGRAVKGSATAGTAAGIGPDGALLVDSGEGVVRVVSGSIELSGGF